MKPIRLTTYSILFFLFGFVSPSCKNSTSTPSELVQTPIRTMDNREVVLSSSQGKVVILDFWAQWCSPCKTSMPLVDSLHQYFEPTDLQVWGVNIDSAEKQKLAIQMSSDLDLKFTSLQDSEQILMKHYGVDVIPTLLVFDKNGVIRERIYGLDEEKVLGLFRLITKLIAE